MTCYKGTGNHFSLFHSTVFFITILKHKHSEFIKMWAYETLFNSVSIVINKEIIFFRVIFISAFFIWVFTLQILILCSFFFSVYMFSFCTFIDTFGQRLLFFQVTNFYYIWFTDYSFWNSNSSVDNGSRSHGSLCRIIWAIAFEMFRGFIINAEFLFTVLFNCFFWDSIGLWLLSSICFSSSYICRLSFHSIWRLKGSDCNCWMLNLLYYFIDYSSLKFSLI